MSKKVLSVVLALVFMLSTFAVTGFAGATSLGWESDTSKTQEWSLGTPAQVDPSTYTIDVMLTANYPVGSISFKLTNDDATAVLDSVVAGEALANYNMDVQVNNAEGLVLLVPSPEKPHTEAISLDVATKIATLTYKVSETTSANIGILNDAKTASNVDGTLIAARMDNGNLISGTPIVGQAVTVGPEVQIGAVVAADPELVVSAAHAADGIVIDTSKTFGGTYAGTIYGFNTYAEGFVDNTYYESCLEAKNGSLQVVCSIYDFGLEMMFGTGTLVYLKDAQGQQFGKPYVVIVFGDSTGDALVDGEDVTNLDLEATNPTVNGFDMLQIMAMNVATMPEGLEDFGAEDLLAATDGEDLTLISLESESPSDPNGFTPLLPQLVYQHQNYNHYCD